MSRPKKNIGGDDESELNTANSATNTQPNIDELCVNYLPLFINDGKQAVLESMEEDEISPSVQDEIIAKIKAKLTSVFVNGNSTESKEDERVQKPERVLEKPKSLKEGLKLFNLHKVSVLTVPKNGRFSDNDFEKGKCIRTYVKLEPYRAEMLNDASHTTGQRYYEIQL